MIGVIGTGIMGRNHVRVASSLNVLAAVADVDSKSVGEISKAFNVKGYTNVEDMLKDENVEAVVVATPTEYHHGIAMKALEHGKHVLVEKPFTSTVEQGEELVKYAEKKGLHLATGQVERFNPVVKFIKDIIKTGHLGKVISISTRRVSSFPGRIRDVGVIFDLGIHDIDVIRYLAGSEVERIYAAADASNDIPFEDHANISLKFSNKILGEIETNWLTPMKVRKGAITCSEGYIEFNYITQEVELSRSSFMNLDVMNLYNIPQKYNTEKIALMREEPLKNEIADFVDAIRNNRKPFVTGKDGLENLRIAVNAVESYRKAKLILSE